MSREPASDNPAGSGLPRTRGDEPYVWIDDWDDNESAPHSRG